VHEIPKDGLSWNALDDLNGRSCEILCQMSFAPSKVCRKLVGQFLGFVIPMDDLNEMLACDLNLVILNCGRYKKVCRTSSFSPDGRRLVLRCVAYLTTRALERGLLIVEHRRSFCCRVLRDHLLCGEACDRLRF
jgi:hypothetical protein